MKKQNFIFSIFWIIIGSIITLLAVLLPKNFLAFLLFILVGVGWWVYDKYIVSIIGWDYVWWSPHLKRIILDKTFIKVFDPEILIINYLITKKFKSYNYSQKKDGFSFNGERKSVGIIAKLSKDELSITFYPTLSKSAVKEMNEFEEYLNKLREKTN